LQDYESAESWAYLDKFICQWRQEEEKVRAQCGVDPAPPYGRCQLFRNQQPTDEWLQEEAGMGQNSAPPPNVTSSNQTTAPVFTPVTTAPSAVLQTDDAVSSTPPIPASAAPIAVMGPTSAAPASIPPAGVGADSVPAEIQCDAYNVSFSRMCASSDPCCGSIRSDTSFCWSTYDTLGDAVQSACYHCCDTPMLVGPAAPEKPGLPKAIRCSDNENPHRLCKENSCCSNPRSTSSFCQETYATLGDDVIEQLCHYCCSTPIELGPSIRRNLRSEEAGPNNDGLNLDTEGIPDGAKVLDVNGKKYLLREENFEEEEEDEQVYFERIYAEHKRRSLVVGAHMENYEDIEWAPYEWLLKVGTEYYYRYEGTMVVPPCFETVHWRPMKDPIIVHKRQIDELNRLMAWRRDPTTCELNTAGIVSADGNRIKANREVQYYHTLHRMVFCECKDWPSKFEGDKKWCKNWKNDTNYGRFYTRPYNFDTNGEWLPTQS
jgi:Eukaryotic-type carbonic anhydrase